MLDKLVRNGLDAFGNLQAGIDVGLVSNNKYENLTNLLNLAGQLLPTLGPAGAALGVGLNQAAATNNTVSAVNKLHNGTLEASDILQITNSVMAGIAAVAVVTGAAVPIGVVITIAVIGLAGGPLARTTVNKAVNQIIQSLNDKVLPPSSAINDNASGNAANGEKVAKRSGRNASSVAKKIKSGVKKAAAARSPLVLDLDNNGINTLSVNNGVNFDLDGNHFAELTGWISHGDGLLVLDKDNNNVIENGNELFGNNTLLNDGTTAANGFLALANYDDNLDHQINVLDAIYSQLRVWVDNGDGVSQANELFSLTELGIASVNVSYTSQGFIDGNGDYQANGSNAVDASGNEHRQISNFTRTDGTTGAVADVWFQVDTTNSVDLTEVEVSDEIANLPEVEGFGNVHNLQVAMQLDAGGALKGLVESFIAEADINARHALVTQILYHWAGVENVDPFSRVSEHYGNAIGDARKLATLEAFVGHGYVGTWCWGQHSVNPHGVAAPILLSAFDELSGYVYAQLMIQSQYADWMGLLDIKITNNELVWDVSGIVDAFESAYAQNKIEAVSRIVDFAKCLTWVEGDDANSILNNLSIYQVVGNEEVNRVLANIKNINLVVAQGDVTHTQQGVSNLVYGRNQDDTIVGASGNDFIYAEMGNDILEGNDGNDVLIGGVGNDTLRGGWYADTYVLNVGDGQDVIEESGSTPDFWYYGGGNDKLIFGEGISKSDIRFFASGVDLILSYSEVDAVTLKNWYVHDWYRNYAMYRVDQVYFANGEVVGLDSLVVQQGITNMGTALGDKLEGNIDVDSLFGLAGDDIIYGYAGRDILIGGLGNDTLYGGINADTYVFSVGDGYDVIEESGDAFDRWFGGGNQDKIILDDVIQIADIQFVHESEDLIMSYGMGDEVRIKNWYVYDRLGNAWSYQVEYIQVAGIVLDMNTLLSQKGVMISGSEVAEVINGDDGNNLIWTYAGEDTINGGDGADTIDAGMGDDVIRGGGGGDVLLGGLGNDVLYSEGGYDTLRGGEGNDVLMGDADVDTYYFELGDGEDVLVEAGGYWSDRYGTSRQDKVVFGLGVDISDIYFSRNRSDLILHYSQADVIVMKNWYASGFDYARIEYIELNDHSVWAMGSLLNNLGVVQFGNGIDTNIEGAGDRDSIVGGAGDEVISTWSACDTLVGGKGNDTLQGGDNADTYVFNVGDGRDVVVESSRWEDTWFADGRQDKLVFMGGIDVKDILFTRSGLDLTIQYTQLDSVRVKNWYVSYPCPHFQVEYMQFADGNMMAISDILLSKKVVSFGTEMDDVLYGSNDPDEIIADGGDDAIFSGGGLDTLYGGVGNDTLQAEAGKDVLWGGKGDDILRGGTGADIYGFELGDGWDTLEEYGSGVDSYYYDGKQDKIIFGDTVDVESIAFTRTEVDLTIHYGVEDQVCIKGWYLYNAGWGTWDNQVEILQFKDQQTTMMINLVNAMSAFDASTEPVKLTQFYQPLPVPTILG
jgi:Ca2+-binding RTX toxin-like protein